MGALSSKNKAQKAQHLYEDYSDHQQLLKNEDRERERPPGMARRGPTLHKHYEAAYVETTPLILQDSTIVGKQHEYVVENVMMKKHMGLWHAIGLIIGGVAGSGIFISPTGVTEHVLSVGSSMIVWAVAGLFNLLLALCYAELGTGLPLAGGDYSYIHYVFGPFPAFLCLWVTVVMMGPCVGALMGRTVATYLMSMLGMDYNVGVFTVISIWVNVTAAYLNGFSVKWTANLLTVFSVAKLLVLAVIIGFGVVKVVQGYTHNFDDIFKDSATDAGSLILGFVPGFAAYTGWDSLNTLAEEMENPGRDLPLSVTISLLIVTFIYVMTNLAYFSVLTPSEFIHSDAVAMLFAERVIPAASWVIPVFVMMSAMGSAIGGYLSYPRFAFAGGRERQLPQVFSYVSLTYFTPTPAIIFICFVSIFYCMAVFFDVQDLILLTGIILQIKVTMTLIVLLKVKYSYPDFPRTITVPWPIVLISLILLIIILVLAVYNDPLVSGAGVMLFLLGIPVYFLGNCCSQLGSCHRFWDWFTYSVQKLMMVVPGGRQD